MNFKLFFQLVAILSPTTAAHEIQNVVHLMLENRAFDTVFGYLNHNPDIDNLVGKKYCNNLDPSDATSPKVCTSNTQLLYSEYEPNHDYRLVTEQLYGQLIPNDSLSHETPKMNGFVLQSAIGGFSKAKNDTKILSQIMAGFDPSKIPVHKTLAEEFTIFDRWFASVPGPTQPNRLFSHMATSKGMFRNDLKRLLFGIPGRTIQQDLADEGLSWRTYFQDGPSFAFLRDTRFAALTHTKPWDQFHKDAMWGKLANYTYLEPNYGQTTGNLKSNDGHASTFFFKTEYLLKEVYETLRISPQWKNTLLLITYDEHGGFHDHVPPPRVPSPDGIISNENGFTYRFDRLGVRVPVMMISPWIAKGAVIHKPEGPYPDTQFEHSSIPATLRSIFKLKSHPLTKREAWAGKFDQYFLKEPRSDCPPVMPAVNVD